MKPIKICFVSLYAYHFFNPKAKSIFGGSEYQMFLMAQEMAKDPSFDVNFVVAAFGGNDFRLIYDHIRLYKSIKPKNLLTKIFGIFFVLPRVLYKINADIYLQKAAGLEVGIIALFCKLFGKKFIYLTANDEDVGNKKPSWMTGGLLGAIRWRLFRWGLKKADLVMVQHQKQKEDFKKYYGKNSVVRLSAQYIPEEKMINLARKKLILWVGKANQKTKQPELFFELARQLPEERFLMICPPSGDQRYFNKVKEAAAKIKNIEFLDGVPSDQIDDYFLRSKIFVNTSLTEGFPNTFIQAMKSKTPIISLNVDPDGILEKYEVGICVKGSMERLKEALKKLLSNHELWQKMGENGYNYVKENHDIQKIIKEDKKVIAKLLGVSI